MKKIPILFVSVLFAQLIWAGNHVIVIKAEPKLTNGSTENVVKYLSAGYLSIYVLYIDWGLCMKGKLDSL